MDGAVAAAAGTVYRTSLVALMRAHDSFGVWAGKTDDAILESFVLTKEARRAIPVIGDSDPKVVWRLEIFYTAVAYAISRRTGHDATTVVKLSDEGFGRVLITVGRLVALSRTVRDVHRFGFESVEALAESGEALVTESLDAIERFPEAAEATT